jgi:hypothetical protein
MQFRTDSPIKPGPYRSTSLVGNAQTLQDPQILSTFLPSFSSLFQPVPRRLSGVPLSAFVQLDIQFEYDGLEPRPNQLLSVSIVKLPSVIAQGEEGKEPTNLLIPAPGRFEAVGNCMFEFASNLAAFEDRGTGYLNTWSLKRNVIFADSTRLHEGDRLAVLVQHAETKFASICVCGVLEPDRPTPTTLSEFRRARTQNDVLGTMQI